MQITGTRKVNSVVLQENKHPQLMNLNGKNESVRELVGQENKEC